MFKFLIDLSGSKDVFQADLTKWNCPNDCNSTNIVNTIHWLIYYMFCHFTGYIYYLKWERGAYMGSKLPLD